MNDARTNLGPVVSEVKFNKIQRLIQAGIDDGAARRVAAEMRAGAVHVKYPVGDTAAPFAGYKQSGNGRRARKWALDEFLEVKAVLATRPPDQ